MAEENSEKNYARFSEGQRIFTQGEPGGDLYFIKSGSVEIFTEHDGERISLARMEKGEVLGVMTCLTNEPRMASARAINDVIAEKVSHDKIKHLVKNMPDWFGIVLKEYSLRLKQVDHAFSVAQVQIKKSKNTQITKLYIASQMAATMAVLADYMAQEIAEKKVVVLEDLMTKLESMLCRSREELDEIMGVILDSGLLKLEIEPDRKRKVIPYEFIQRMPFLVQFIRETRSGPKKKLIQTQFAFKERKMIVALSRYAKSKQMKVQEMVHIPIKELEENFSKTTGENLNLDTINKAAKVQLLQVESPAANSKIAFVPATLVRNISALLVTQKLDGIEPDSQDSSE